MIRKILRILTREERRHLVVHMVLDILIAIADIVFLAGLLLILNYYTDKGGQMGRLAFLAPLLKGRNPMLLISAFFVAFCLKNGIGFIVFRGQCRYLLAVASRISRQKLYRYFGGSYANYINIDTSVQIREVSYYPRDFSQHILGGVQHVFTQSLLIVLAIVGIALFNVKLCLLLFVILLPPVFAAFYFMRKRLHSVRVVARSSSEKYLQHLQEALTGYVEGNVYHKEDSLVERYLGVQGIFNKSVADQLIILGIPGRLVEVFAIFGLVIIIGLSSLSGNTDHATILTIGVFMAAAYKIIPGIVKIMNAVGQMNTYGFTVDHLVEEDEPAAAGSDVAVADGMPAPVVDGSAVPVIREIECRQLGFSYRGQRVLDRQDLVIRKGEFVGICGPSGQGKSTILNLLLGFLTPDEGGIYINGMLTSAEERKGYWGRMAYVKQQAFLLHDSIGYNITLEEKVDRESLADAARMTGLQGLVDSFPEKWGKVIAENGKNISGGQRQRIAFTRALYRGADWLILDEPFSELDESSEREMMEVCRELARQGKTIVMITHNKNNLLFFHKTVVLDEV